MSHALSDNTPLDTRTIGAIFAMPFFADECALFLDIDGTLAPFALTPDDAHIPESVLRDLGKLQDQLNGAVAMVSGRSMPDIDRMSAPHVLPAAALHGLEIRLPNGRVELPQHGEEWLNPARETIRELAHRHPEIFIEDKGFSLAVHYRRKPELEHGMLDILRSLQTACAEHVFLQEGKLVGELRLRGGDKGTAIQRLMQCAPFQGRRPVFAGDDKTDEDAFRAVNALGGHSIKIGGGETEAVERFASPDLFHRWLHALSAHFAASRSTHPHHA